MNYRRLYSKVTIGYGAARYLIAGSSGGMVGLKGGSIVIFDLEGVRMSDGHYHIRPVDLHSGSYEVAIKYQIRLLKSDLDDAELVKKMSDACHLDPSEFVRRFSHIAM